MNFKKPNGVPANLSAACRGPRTSRSCLAFSFFFLDNRKKCRRIIAQVQQECLNSAARCTYHYPSSGRFAFSCGGSVNNSLNLLTVGLFNHKSLDFYTGRNTDHGQVQSAASPVQHEDTCGYSNFSSKWSEATFSSTLSYDQRIVGPCKVLKLLGNIFSQQR